ncbi:MAG: hypothetical protein KI790_11545 [Cyclobacteriaceae bacterium]|nr:hypothetical protein [Cyclobacteriaceae bacterium HetDA_MAG_MS6]
MRTLILLFALSIFSTIEAHARRSSIVFDADIYMNIKVFLNGKPVNHRPSSRVFINDLRPGKHLMTIVAFKGNRVREMTGIFHLVPQHKTRFVVRDQGPYRGLFIEKVSTRPLSRPDRYHYDHDPIIICQPPTSRHYPKRRESIKHY